MSFLGAPGRASTGDQIVGFDLYEYWVDIDPLALVAGTTYWLSIVNNSLENGGDTWAWASSDFSSVNGAARLVDGDDWSSGFDHAFNLTGNPIPEPNAALIFGVGLIVVGRAMREK